MKIIMYVLSTIIIYTIIYILTKYISNIKKRKNIISDKLNSTILESNINLKFKSFSTCSIIVIFSIFLSLLVFSLSYNYLKVVSSSLIISLLSLVMPFYILKYKIYLNKQKLINMFPNYVISLKNYTDVNNDIVEAFKRADVQKPLKTYINKFSVSVEKGLNIYDAFESLKSDINIVSIGEFISLLQFCYINGGNFTILLDKFCKLQMKKNVQKEKERQEIFSSKLVLILLIVLNIYILFGFIFSSSMYFGILTGTFIGKAILNINILSYIFILYIYSKLNKMEE